jgi:hypothetical protein
MNGFQCLRNGDVTTGFGVCMLSSTVSMKLGATFCNMAMLSTNPDVGLNGVTWDLAAGNADDPAAAGAVLGGASDCCWGWCWGCGS